MLASNLDLLTGSYLISFVDILVHKYTEHLIWFSTCQTTIWSEHVANCILRKNSIDECIVILFLVLLIILSHDPKIVCVIVHACICNEHIAFWFAKNYAIHQYNQHLMTSHIIFILYAVSTAPANQHSIFWAHKVVPPPQLTIWLWLISNLLEYLIYSSSSWYPFCYYQLINYRKYKEGCYCDFTNIHVHT